MQNSSTAKLPPVADLLKNILLDMTAKEEDVYTPTTFSSWLRAVFLSS